MRSRLVFVPLAAIVAQGGPAWATVYLSIEQAQALMFPGATFQPDTRTLTSEQAKAIEHASGVNVRSRQLRVWRVSTGGWFIADEVVGKHEFVPFAVGLDASGAVKAIEILEYREAYGGEIREESWRRQFLGKRAGARLQLNRDIPNISGATLSSKHITDGVTRLLATYEIVLKQPVR